jgi:hypothetical protein
MQVKLLEVRDEGTCIHVVAVDMNPPLVDDTVSEKRTKLAQRAILRRHGFPCDGRPNIAIFHVRCSGDRVWNDPYGWGGRTYPVAHNHIIDNWARLSDGDVVDVQHILGETPAPKTAEWSTHA